MDVIHFSEAHGGDSTKHKNENNIPDWLIDGLKPNNVDGKMMYSVDQENKLEARIGVAKIWDSAVKYVLEQEYKDALDGLDMFLPQDMTRIIAKLAIQTSADESKERNSITPFKILAWRGWRKNSEFMIVDKDDMDLFIKIRYTENQGFEIISLLTQDENPYVEI
jgi:hypothetical protein